jgi:hypothetical protein
MFRQSKGNEMSQAGDVTNSGAGNEEPDPATAENPPVDIKAGDEKREQDGAPETAAQAGAGGLD